ncbi:K(+) efflux antiporter 2, chloroplastic-like [Papaver somniferum]|uniref:K(+) efflux antiporter 2, chloroplastic-like n=1 Tax=Papaver somniferum TaxID=3469 RepID=UPI000E6FF878|nr:K(+) efflux antiporter 2, chloroplastic-like [Papaver somniferum]
MDIAACSFGQPYLCIDKSITWKSNFTNSSRLRFRCKSFDYGCIGKSRMCLDSSLKKKISNKSIVRDNSLLWAKPLRNGNSSNVVKMSRNLLGRIQCDSSDSLAFVDGDELTGNDSDEKEKGNSGDESFISASISDGDLDSSVEGDKTSLEDLRDLLQKAIKELGIAERNSRMFEEKAQKISEAAIALKDEAANAWTDVTSALNAIQNVVAEENVAKEAVQKATMAVSMAEARLELALEALDNKKRTVVSPTSSVESNEGDERTIEGFDPFEDEEEEVLLAQDEIKDSRVTLLKSETELRRVLSLKEGLQNEVDKLTEIAEKAQMSSLKAEEDVGNVMLLAEQAVAFELEAAQHVNDAEIALQRAEKVFSGSNGDILDSSKLVPSSQEPSLKDEVIDEIIKVSGEVITSDVSVDKEIEGGLSSDMPLGALMSLDHVSDVSAQTFEESNISDDLPGQENGKIKVVESRKEVEVDMEPEAEKSKNVVQSKKQESQKDFSKDTSAPPSTPKANKSSRFFSASFFSFPADGAEATPASAFQGFVMTARQHLPKIVVGALLLGTGFTFFLNRAERNSLLLQQPDVITMGIEEVSSNAKPFIREIKRFPKRVKKLIDMIPHQEVNEEETSLFDMLWLLLASVIFVPTFQKIPGGSPVLGYLAAGILIGPYGLSIIRHVHGTKAIAEFGVVFLLFNIGLELSVERLSSMKKYVFGLGSVQVLLTAVVIGLVTHFIGGQAGPAAIVIGNGLALSSTAVVLQVLQERGESTSRHGRATFSVLLFQDLAVVVLLILIPLISPNSSKGGVGFQAIAEALGVAAVKAVVAITAIIAGGRLLLRPIYRQIAENQNAEIFSANTLLVILGTSLLTARAGLSMALGAFLAGLLLAETEFSLQVESDIAPYRGLLLGLFFMTVGMSIDPKLLLSNFPVVMGALGLLLGGKIILVALIGRLFGISIIAAIRVGLLLAPGGEFAFVAFGEAVNQGIMSPQLSSLLFLVVGISMALTPYLAAGGQLLASRFEQHDMRSLLPVESETDDLQGHIIICGFGRVGQIIAQLLSERLIPFVALDVRSERVAIGRALDLPVFFGDAGSREVLHKVGAERACAAAVTLDTPGANYRTVWALNKYYPNVKTFVRAHDVDHGINLEKAGATAVVPETLEPSLQLAAAVLAQAKLPTAEIAATINEFRSRHLSELTELCEASGSSLGYGFSRVMSKPKIPILDSPEDNSLGEGTLAI